MVKKSEFNLIRIWKGFYLPWKTCHHPAGYRGATATPERVLVMRHGTIVDRLAAGELADATHPYTRALWNARPSGETYGTKLPVVADEGEA